MDSPLVHTAQSLQKKKKRCEKGTRLVEGGSVLPYRKKKRTERVRVLLYLRTRKGWGTRAFSKDEGRERQIGSRQEKSPSYTPVNTESSWGRLSEGTREQENLQATSGKGRNSTRPGRGEQLRSTVPCEGGRAGEGSRGAARRKRELPLLVGTPVTVPQKGETRAMEEARSRRGGGERAIAEGEGKKNRTDENRRSLTCNSKTAGPL